MVLATTAGWLAKIADDVKRGEREKFWTKRLFLDLPAVVMMSILTMSTAAYFELPGVVSGGVGTVFGWMGPRGVDYILQCKIANYRGRDDK